MLVATLFTQPDQRSSEIVQILSIFATRTFALQDLLRQRIRILRAQELWIGWEADVHETAYTCWRGIGAA